MLTKPVRADGSVDNDRARRTAQNISDMIDGVKNDDAFVARTMMQSALTARVEKMNLELVSDVVEVAQKSNRNAMGQESVTVIKPKTTTEFLADAEAQEKSRATQLQLGDALTALTEGEAARRGRVEAPMVVLVSSKASATGPLEWWDE
eukprot:TRINITY_DN3667_c0_g1_i1.p1 TRINITY_DN3667_c0_g1~~TRINITY_DN3667_c0_g1_i1.p1  ORF type:complete len:149 (-),score=6.36 TRINITY_DN3667_c0_g1_i1:5-451(-)